MYIKIWTLTMKCTQYVDKGVSRMQGQIYFQGSRATKLVGIKKFMPKGAKLQAMALTHLHVKVHEYMMGHD